MPQISYTAVRSSRRTVAVEVRRSGEVILRLPRSFPRERENEIISARAGWIEKTRARLAAVNDPFKASRDEIEELRRLARDYIPERTRELAERFSLSAGRIRISSAKTRWGSCSANNTLSFSLFLMRYPAEAVDAVICHELAHTVHHNHSRSFYALLLEMMPDYHEKKALLTK